MSYPRIAAKVFSSLWAMQPTALSSLLTVLHSRLAGGTVAPEVLASMREHGPADRFSIAKATANGPLVPLDSAVSSTPDSSPSTLVIFGSGILGKHLSSMEETCAGGLSVDRLQAALTVAAADPTVKNIVLHLDTPGGVVTGIPETAALIAQIRQTKNVVAYVDSLCASAGYWIASACDYIYVTPSAEVGSVGVYSAFHDVTAYYAAEGVKVELFKDGVYKAAGFPGTSLTDAQRADIQQGVLDCSAQFKATVKTARAQIEDASLQGQCFTGASAVTAGLADALVNSLGEVLADLAALSEGEAGSEKREASM